MIRKEKRASRPTKSTRRFVTDVLANFPDPVMVVTSRGRVLMQVARTIPRTSRGRAMTARVDLIAGWY